MYNPFEYYIVHTDGEEVAHMLWKGCLSFKVLAQTVSDS